MNDHQLPTHTYQNNPSWSAALEVVKSTLEIPSVLPPLIKNSWSGLYDTTSFMHAIGFPGWNARSILRAARISPATKEPTPADVERAVSTLGVRLSSLVVAVNFVCRAALTKRPASTLWMPLFKDTMTAIEVGYSFGSIAPDIGIEGGALLGFAQNAGLTVLLAHDPERFAQLQSSDSSNYNADLSVDLFGCEPYQIGALTVQQLGFGADIALAAALAHGTIPHQLIEVAPVVTTWKAAIKWIEALRRGALFPTDAESRTAFQYLLSAEPDGNLSRPLEQFHTKINQVCDDSSAWTWHLPKESYEDTLEHLASPPQSTVKGKVWKTEKRHISIERR